MAPLPSNQTSLLVIHTGMIFEVTITPLFKLWIQFLDIFVSFLHIDISQHRFTNEFHFYLALFAAPFLNRMPSSARLRLEKHLQVQRLYRVPMLVKIKLGLEHLARIDNSGRLNLVSKLLH